MSEESCEWQNSGWALDGLAARRLLYRQVKSTENWHLALILLVAALLLAGMAVEAGPFSQGVMVAVVLLWTFDQVLMVRRVGDKKEEAATIQEEFDCHVLDIPWPDHIGVARPTGDRVRVLVESAQRAGMEREDLADWYRPADIPGDPLKARLHCQRVNCHWDSRLRREWMCCSKFAVGGTVALGIVLGAIAEIDLLKVLPLARNEYQTARVAVGGAARTIYCPQENRASARVPFPNGRGRRSDDIV